MLNEMADSSNRKRTPAPAPLDPANGAVVDGASVTFRWEAVEGATEYLLEVATDAGPQASEIDFEDLAFEQRVEGGKTALTVANVFGTDGDRFYWRVLANSDLGWSNGDRVESFIAATAEQAGAHLARPEDDVDPVISLVKASAAGVAAEVSQDEELRRLQEEGVAPEGVPAGQVLMIGATILFIIFGIVFTLVVLSGNEFRDVTSRRYQDADYFDLNRARTEAEVLLEQYEVVDDENGVYRVPIQQAMELMLYEARQEQGGRTYSEELPLLPRQRAAVPPEQPAVVLDADTTGAPAESAAAADTTATN